MNALTRRLATVALGGALAVASLTGCGIIGGSAVDCASISDEMLNVSNSLGTDGFEDAVSALKKEGESIGDSELKGALETYIEEVETLDEQMKSFKSGDLSAESPDLSKMKEASKTFEEKCSAV